MGTDDKFERYEPEAPEALRPAVTSLVGKTAKEKTQARIEKIRKREAENRKASSVEIYVQERLERRLRSIPTQLDSVVRNREGSLLVGGEGHAGPPNSKRSRHDCIAVHTRPGSPVEQQPAKALRTEKASRKRQLEKSE